MCVLVTSEVCMTSVGSIQSTSIAPSFKSERTRLISIEKHNDYEARIYETPASTGKKWGVGIASFLCSGLGQAINGQWGKAAGFFFGSLGLGAISGVSMRTNPTLSIISGLGTLGIGIWSIVDAVRNAKTETTQIIPKNINTQTVNVVG